MIVCPKEVCPCTLAVYNSMHCCTQVRHSTGTSRASEPMSAKAPASMVNDGAIVLRPSNEAVLQVCKPRA